MEDRITILNKEFQYGSKHNILNEYTMKKYIFYLIAFLAISCEDVLDKKNLGAIDDSYVWSDPNMIELNVNSFYVNGCLPVYLSNLHLFKMEYF